MYQDTGGWLRDILSFLEIKRGISTMAHDVFISYAEEDQKIAERVCAELEANSIACWIASRDIPPGEKLASAKIQAINACTLFLLIFSSHANKSPQVMNEVKHAFNKNKIILPFRIENLEANEELGFFIGSREWLNAFSPSYEQYLPKLTGRVRSICRQTSEPPSVERADPQTPPLRKNIQQDGYIPNRLLIIFVFLPFSVIWIPTYGGALTLFLDVIAMILIHGDAKKIHSGQNAHHEKMFEPWTWAPLSWAIITLVFWIFGLGFYLINRHMVYSMNQ
jgi:hypothetical protein